MAEDRVPRFESWIERQIREATERGEFDNLPGAGKPLQLPDTPDPDWWIKAKLEKEDLREVLPAPLALRREKQDIQSALADVRSERDARQIVADLNERIKDSNINPVTTPRIIIGPLDAEQVLDEWAARGARVWQTGSPPHQGQCR